MRQAGLWLQWKDIIANPTGRLGRTYFFINDQTDMTHFLNAADGPDHHPSAALNQLRSNTCWTYVNQLPEVQRKAFARARCVDLPTGARCHHWDKKKFPTPNCPYCQNRHHEDGSPIIDSNAHWLSGVCGAPGCAEAGQSRHTQGCQAVAARRAS